MTGNVGSAPVKTLTKAGETIATFSITPVRSKKESEGSEPTWWKVSVFGKQAEATLDYVGKGDRLSLCGDISFEKYKDKQGNDRESKVIKYAQFCFPQKSLSPNKKPESSEDSNQASFDDDVPF